MKLTNLSVIIGLLFVSTKHALANNTSLRNLGDDDSSDDSSDIPCGNLHEECCFGSGPACQGYLGCDYSETPPKCTDDCGGEDEPCCNIDVCNSPRRDTKGGGEGSIFYDHEESCECICDDGLTFDISSKTCVRCGTCDGDDNCLPCCDGGCDAPYTCLEASNMCSPCGDEGEPGCSNDDKPCGTGLVLNEEGICVPCGRNGQPGCPGDLPCKDGLTLNAVGNCQVCGDLEQLACPNSDHPCLCDLVPNAFGVCVYCGWFYEPGCAGDSPCMPGLVLNAFGKCQKCGYCKSRRYGSRRISTGEGLLVDSTGEDGGEDPSEDYEGSDIYNYSNYTDYDNEDEDYEDAEERGEEYGRRRRCFPCCEGGCNPGHICKANGMCSRCGEYKDYCCDGHKCSAGLVCSGSGRCVPCGLRGEPCCDVDAPSYGCGGPVCESPILDQSTENDEYLIFNDGCGKNNFCTPFGICSGGKRRKSPP